MVISSWLRLTRGRGEIVCTSPTGFDRTLHVIGTKPCASPYRACKIEMFSIAPLMMSEM
ncbi:MAG: hypothetical protein LDL41_02165 [Coleofasciculus sp. S288]|nr:hypothetical protein [Coleofasciculus sp. S288]